MELVIKVILLLFINELPPEKKEMHSEVVNRDCRKKNKNFITN